MGIEFCIEQEFSLQMRKFLREKASVNGTAASVAIISENCAAAATVGINPNDLKPVTRIDRFAVASVSKIYCALAVMKLAEEGKLTLDAPVAEYLPRFTMRDRRYRSITLRMCLNHSSGLPGTHGKNEITARWLDVDCFSERYDYFSKASLKADPGTYSTYCNDGFSLAEMVVAAVSGRGYMDFLKSAITDPAGADSTGDGNPENGLKALIHMKDQPAEYVMAVGSGGIVTNLLDCAKVGALFLNAHGILKEESIREMAVPQDMFLAETQGLGWDTVDFRHKNFDFGSGALGKQGGTVQHVSYLLVSGKYGVSAAISATRDMLLDPIATLCELCAQFLEARRNLTVRRTRADRRIAIPANMDPAADFPGIYMTAEAVYRISTNRDSISLDRYEHCSGWAPYVEKAGYNGDGFACDKGVIQLKTKGNKDYLLMETDSETLVIGQKIDLEALPELYGAWKNRVGKTYLACDMHPGDYQPAGGMTIEQFEGSGLLLFHKTTQEAVPVITRNNDETESILDAPGYPGSQNIFAPYAFARDGRAYIYGGDFEYVDADTLAFLKDGRIVLQTPCRNMIYRINAGKKIRIMKSSSVRTMMLKRDLSVYYDELFQKDMPLTCEGYLVFAGNQPSEIIVAME